MGQYFNIQDDLVSYDLNGRHEAERTVVCDRGLKLHTLDHEDQTLFVYNSKVIYTRYRDYFRFYEFEYNRVTRSL